MAFVETKSWVCVPGFKASGVRSKVNKKYGLALIVSNVACECAGVFTQNSVKSATVLLTGRLVRENKLRAVVANSGNANACVRNGLRDAELMGEIAAESLGLKPAQVGVSSTGIIGRRINLGIIGDLVKEASLQLECSPQASRNAAKAIMTTDTREKMFSLKSGGLEVGGIAKGAGMISPNMATMLCFITTNADFPRRILQASLENSVEKSFNMLVVDGDMSTNDTALLLSNRQQKCSLKLFQKMLDTVTLELAKKIARDGEGASKYLEFAVRGASSERDARLGVKAIASSPLVKTAFYGGNLNWGRIASALGAKVRIDFNRVDVTIEGVYVVKKGVPVEKNYARAEDSLRKKEIKVVVDLHQGNCNATAYSCDLTPEYVKINAGYS